MGMFDYVLVEQPIEGIADAAFVEWQTKDFDAPFMLKYKISREGRLLREIVRYEDRSDPTAPEGSFQRFRGMMTPVHEGWEDLAYHGDLNFYSYIGDDFVDLIARFTHGTLEGISRLPTEDGAA